MARTIKTQKTADQRRAEAEAMQAKIAAAQQRRMD